MKDTMNNDSDSTPTGDFQSIGSEPESVYEIIVREMEDTVFLVEVTQTTATTRSRSDETTLHTNS